MDVKRRTTVTSNLDPDPAPSSKSLAEKTSPWSCAIRSTLCNPSSGEDYDIEGPARVCVPIMLRPRPGEGPDVSALLAPELAGGIRR